MTTLLLYGDTESSPAMRHEIPLSIGDLFMFADIDGRRAVLTNGLEREDGCETLTSFSYSLVPAS